ncbi:MAG: hypothetical protein QE271_07265 [Bacteriovoracaceae bacterium]|nr:hypothetical protein [Bacteriovoracaceae bacterium]
MNSIVVVRQKKLFITWIVVGFLFFFIPTSYFILKNQFDGSIFQRGVVNTIHNNFPYLQVELGGPQFKLSSRIKYDLDKVTISVLPEMREKFPFQRLEFTNLKVRVPILFLLGGRKIEISADKVVVTNFDYQKKNTISDLFGKSNLSFYFPTLIRNNKFNANFTKIIFENAQNAQNDQSFSQNQGLIQISEFRNTILRDINFRNVMALETTVEGNFLKQNQTDWTTHVTGEFKLLDFLAGNKSNFKFFVRVVKSPWDIFSQWSWELTPLLASSANSGTSATSATSANSAKPHSSGLVFNLRQKTNEESGGFQGSLTMDDHANYYLELENNLIKKNFLENYLFKNDPENLKNYDSNSSFAAKFKTSISKNNNKLKIDFALKDNKNSQVLYSIKTIENTSPPGAQLLYLKTRIIPDLSGVMLEENIYHSLFLKDSTLVSTHNKLDGQGTSISKLLNTGISPLNSLVKTLGTEIFPKKMELLGLSNGEIPWELNVDNFLVENQKQEFISKAKISQEGISFYELLIQNAENKKIHTSGKLIFRNNEDNKDGPFKSLLLSLSLQNSPGSLWSWVLLKNNIILSGLWNGSLIASFSDEKHQSIELKIKSKNSSFHFPKLAEELSTMLPREKGKSLFNLPFECSSAEINAQWSPTQFQLQAVLVGSKLQASKKFYLQATKNENESDIDIKIFSQKPSFAKVKPFYQGKLLQDSLSSSNWKFQTL